MSFSIIYPITSFTSKGANPVQTCMLRNEVLAEPAITDVLEGIYPHAFGSDNTDTGKSFRFDFAGAGPSLAGGGQAALDAVVAAHTGVYVPDDSPITGGTDGQVWSNVGGSSYGWVTPAASAVQFAEISSTSQTNSSSSYGGITGLDTLTVVNGGVYRFESVVYFSMSGTSGSPGIAIASSGALADVNGSYIVPKTATATLYRAFSGADAETDSTSITITANTTLPFHIRGRFTASADGTISMRVKRYGSGTVSLKPWSWYRLERIS